MSDDASYIAFISSATDLVSAAGAVETGAQLDDVFLQSLVSGERWLLSPNTSRLCGPPDIASLLPNNRVHVVFPTNSCDAEMGPFVDNCDGCGTPAGWICGDCAAFALAKTGAAFDPCHDVYRVNVQFLPLPR
ncbi:MAG: hypothetical protein AAF628_30890 [Planctomycetota bacterium]